MSAELNELMASNDPMATPVMPVGPPPAMPTHPSSDSVAQQPIAPMMQPPVHQTQPPAQQKKKSLMQNSELKEAFLVALLCFIVLMPGVQRTLITQLSFMEDKTNAALVTSSLVGISFFFIREHLQNII